MKKVAKTLKDLPTSDIYLRICDGDDSVDDIISELKDHWAYDLYSRSPGPALLENGALKPTDLDLACFLSALADRRAVINIPTYKSRRAASYKSNERVVSKDNRHGQVHGLTSNQDVFSFSIRIKDFNVVVTETDGSETVGAFRNFMLVDLEGDWYDGWKCIEFAPNRKENDFLNDKKLWTGNVVYFKNFVHPNRWTSFYGQWYVLTKILVERLRAEVTFRNAEAKAIEAILSPSKDKPAFSPRPASDKGPSEPIIVTAFEAEVDADIPSTFHPFPRTREGLAFAKERAHKLQYEDIPTLNFAVRATELAFCERAGIVGGLEEGKDVPKPEPGKDVAQIPMAPWISGAKWDRDYKIKRTVWNRLVLAQPVPFEKGLALRYRVRAKTERVRPED